MTIERDWTLEWFALTMDQKLFHLGNCGDYDAAEEVAQNALSEENIWILIDGEIAEQWQYTLEKGLGEAGI